MANIYPERSDVKEWLAVLEGASRGQHYPALFKRLYKMMAVPSRRREAVSIYRINKYTKAGANVIVPRKVLSTGKIDHKINITALDYSEGARKALREAGCSMLTIKEMVGKDRIQVMV